MCLRNKGKTFTSNFCWCRSVYLHIAKMCRNVCSECSDRSGADFLSLLWDLGLGRHVTMVWRCLEWRLQYPESRNYGLHIIKYRWRQLVQMPCWQKSLTIQKAIGDSCGLLLLYAVSEHYTLHSKHSQTSLTCLGPGPRWWFIDICVSSVCATWQTIVSWPPPPARQSGFLKYISYNLQFTTYTPSFPAPELWHTWPANCCPALARHRDCRLRGEWSPSTQKTVAVAFVFSKWAHLDSA